MHTITFFVNYMCSYIRLKNNSDTNKKVYFFFVILRTNTFLKQERILLKIMQYKKETWLHVLEYTLMKRK